VTRSKISLLAICMLTIGLMATSARADVTYTFSGMNDSIGTGSEPIGFQFSSSTFITSLTSLTQSQLSSCTNCLNSPSPDVILAPNVPTLGDLLQFNDSNNVSSVFEFAAGSFGAVGTYQSGEDFNPTGTLTVAVSQVAVPEPGSVALTLVGGMMLALFAFLRRKPLAANPLA
jgi:hypothetical protein